MVIFMGRFLLRRDFSIFNTREEGKGQEAMGQGPLSRKLKVKLR